MAKVVWSPKARAHLRAINDQIAASAPGAANRLIERIYHRVTQLELFPESGSWIPEEDRRARQVLVLPYRVIYDVELNGVLILAVVHGARDLNAADFRDSGDDLDAEPSS